MRKDLEKRLKDKGLNAQDKEIQLMILETLEEIKELLEKSEIF